MIDRWLHPKRRIVAALEGRLAPRAKQSLERHLAGCAACRGYRERIATTIVRLDADVVDGTPPPLPALPDLRAERPPQPRSTSVRWLAVATASTIVVAGVLLLRVRATERLDVVAATSAPAPFEALALAEHRARVEGAPALEIESSSARELRTWLVENGKFSAGLIEPRAGGGGVPAIELLGARRAAADGARGAVVATRIDGRPATLLVGHAAEVTGIPEWSLLGKQLQVRHDAARGEHLLSWRNAGKAYTLVTDPATPPQAACRLCHDGPHRLATIERVAGEL